MRGRLWKIEKNGWKLTMLMSHHPVPDDIIGHAEHEDAARLLAGLSLLLPLDPGRIDGAHHGLLAGGPRVLHGRADDHVVADGVVHLIAVLGVDADPPGEGGEGGALLGVPDDVVVHGGGVGAVDGDRRLEEEGRAHLEGVEEGVPLEEAGGAVVGEVEVHAVPGHHPPPPPPTCRAHPAVRSAPSWCWSPPGCPRWRTCTPPPCRG